MKKIGEDKLIAFLFILVCFQAYVVFFKNPAALVREGNNDVLLQNSGERPPARGGGEGVPTTLYQVNTPAAPGAAGVPQPGVPPVAVGAPPGGTQPTPTPHVMPAAGSPAPAGNAVVQRAPTDPYRTWLAGVVLLEKEGRLSLTPQQARVLLDAVRRAESAKSAVPDAQKAILETLTSAQKAFVKELMGKRKEPPPPQGLDALVRKVITTLDAR